MPNIHSNSRFNSENKFGDRVLKPRKSTAKTHSKGCPSNDGKEHLYGAVKTITVPTVKDVKTLCTYSVACIFCDKKKITRGKRSSQKPYCEVYQTDVLFLGEKVPGKFWSFYVKKKKTYPGDTDANGRAL